MLVGGSWQNSDSAVPQATSTTVEQGALLQANATDTGSGGIVVAWSDITKPLSVTRAFGTFEAKGGPNGGDGGWIETSGHRLDVEGIEVDGSSTNGMSGEWLLDPWNVIIWNSASGTAYISPYSSFTPSTDSVIRASDIVHGLENGNVTISTGSSSSNTLSVNSPIDASLTSGNLTLQGGTIVLNWGGIVTGGNQVYLGNTILGADTTLESKNGGIGFRGEVNGAYDLSITLGSVGRLVFNCAVGGTTPLASISVGSRGQTYINDDITTSGYQAYNNAVLFGTIGTPQFNNGDFESGLSGWDVFNTAARLGIESIGGFTSPIDSTSPPTHQVILT